MNKNINIERILWSIALPGFGQILNGHLLKGIAFISLEFLINIKSNLNQAIISSFQGNTILAIQQTNYQWLMFYPCIYMFAMWDAYKNAGDTKIPHLYLPFVLSAYLGTIGVIFSSVLKINNFFLGPVFLPIICFFAGTAIGFFIRYLILRYSN